MTEDQLAYLKARDIAEASDSPQERNRLWWETLPMTYAGWSETDRVPETSDDFSRIENAFLDGNPWLKEHWDFGAFAGKKVLEIGCGSGVASCLFAKGGAQATGIDLTSQAIEISTRNARAQGLDSTVFKQMDAEHLEFPDATFDCVFSWGVLHHSSRPQRGVAEASRVLKPGGSGLVMVYNSRSFRYWAYGLYLMVVKGQMFKGHTMQTVQGLVTDGYYQRHYSPGELRRLLAEAGLKTTRVSASHMAKKYVPLVPVGLDEAIKRRFGWLLIAEFVKEGTPR